jgi:hypothetical protein
MELRYTDENGDPVTHHSGHFIAPVGDTSEDAKIYFDVDPVTLPVYTPPRSVTRVKCTRANVGGTITSGASVVYDFGSSPTDATIEIILPFATLTTKNRLEALYSVVAPVWYYNSHSNTYVKCCWNDLKFNAYSGIAYELFSCSVSLMALGSQVATRDD